MDNYGQVCNEFNGKVNYKKANVKENFHNSLIKYCNWEMNGQEDRCAFKPDVYSSCRSLFECDFECSYAIWFGDVVPNFV